MLIEKASLGDALWWCTVTWFTVGYGDSVPLTGWGRVFGIYAIVNHVTVHHQRASPSDAFSMSI
jgi:hypothetical protein